MTVTIDVLRLTALFVRAAGLSDDVAVEWLGAELTDPQATWHQHGGRVLAELAATGHERIQERLVDLLGRPAA